MPQLTITDFNTPEYFGYGYVWYPANPDTGAVEHWSSVPLPGGGNIPGGYGLWHPIHYFSDNNQTPANEYWYTKAQKFIEHGGMVGLKVLEIGCAFGSMVRAMRQLGADAYGLDLSWPISKGIELWPELAPYLIVADVRTWLASADRKRNEYEAVISRGWLHCLTDAELTAAIPRLNFITKNMQIHSIDPNADNEYYNVKTVAQWEALPFEAGTLILDEAS